MLRDPLNVMPQAVMAYSDAKVSLGHINAFLKSGHRHDSDIDSSNACDYRPYSYGERVKVGFYRAVFQWPVHDDILAHDIANYLGASHSQQQNDSEEQAPSRPFILRIPDLEFPSGQLSVILGPHQSGKSSLLCALLGEMTLISGIMLFPSRFLSPETMFTRDDLDRSLYMFRVAYVPQTPWIQTTTVRENILFFEPWDEMRYRMVLSQCDLLRDLSQMENGDLTEIGERGVPLTGKSFRIVYDILLPADFSLGLPVTESQKHKISLARAVYSRAKTILIDDIFVSFEKANELFIFEKCLLGELMTNRTIIMATSKLRPWARNARLVVRMEKGTVSALESGETITDWVEANQLPMDTMDAASSLNDDRIEPLFETMPVFDDDEMLEQNSVMRESIRAVDDELYLENQSRSVAYTAYLAACGDWTFWFAALIFMLGGRLASISESFWLKEGIRHNQNSVYCVPRGPADSYAIFLWTGLVNVIR